MTPTLTPSSGAKRPARPALRAAGALLAAFALALAVFAVLRGGDAPVAAGPALGELRPAGATTDATIRSLQAEIRAGRPRESELAGAYLQKARETGDLSYSTRAEALLHRALHRGRSGGPAAL